MSKPNLLFILTDQQRADSLPCYGNTHLQVPNLNQVPHEMTNRFDAPNQHDRIAEMIGQIRRWQESVADTILYYTKRQ